jgi:hypothetical protein
MNEFVDPTLFTPVFFLTNSLTAIYMDNYLYSILFLNLFCTSLLCRLYVSELTYLIDIVAIYLTVVYGAYSYMLDWIKYTSASHGVILSTFMFTIFFHHYGYVSKEYCYNKDIYVAKQYSSLVHIISSLGHHMIILSQTDPAQTLLPSDAAP